MSVMQEGWPLWGGRGDMEHVLGKLFKINVPRHCGDGNIRRMENR